MLPQGCGVLQVSHHHFRLQHYYKNNAYLIINYQMNLFMKIWFGCYR